MKQYSFYFKFQMDVLPLFGIGFCVRMIDTRFHTSIEIRKASRQVSYHRKHELNVTNGHCIQYLFNLPWAKSLESDVIESVNHLR